MKNTKKTDSKAGRKTVVPIVIFALFISLCFWNQGRSVFRPKTFCRQVEADADYISSAISDYFSIHEHHYRTLTQNEIEVLVDVDNPWRLTPCGDRLFIHVVDRSGKCPAEYQDQWSEWNSNIYTLEFPLEVRR